MLSKEIEQSLIDEWAKIFGKLEPTTKNIINSEKYLEEKLGCSVIFISPNLNGVGTIIRVVDFRNNQIRKYIPNFKD